MGGLLREHAQRIPRTTVRVFGEMVDALCRAGHMDGAIALEGLWNGLAHTHRFLLLCGHSMRTFVHDSHTASVASICRQHAHVIPTERYFEVAETDRLREVTMLQQRARARETEAERREQLEHSLRIALKKAESANDIFEPFVQIAAGPAGMREGVGLGLSISRTLARGMGGDLTVDSRPECGSSFVLLLPVFERVVVPRERID